METLGKQLGILPSTAHTNTKFGIVGFAALHTFDTLPIETQVSEVAVKLRKKHNIKLPDAIVWATAQVNKRILVTRNTKDFSQDEPGVRVPYQL